jgi:hypothetical protein
LLAARYRVEVRDKEGEPVTTIEDDSRSFTMNFIELLIASHYNQNNVPTFAVYNYVGSPFYTGSTQSPGVGVPPQIFNMDYTVPPIWLGTSPCPDPALANGPCGSLVACCPLTPYPFSPFNFNPNAACYGVVSCSPSLTEKGWALTITSRWANRTQSPVTVASMALLFDIYVFNPAIERAILARYAAIVDNLPSPVAVSPGYLITVSYTLYFPV